MGPSIYSILTPLGAIAAYRASSILPIELTASVEAGLTYQVDVVAISSSIRELELSTSCADKLGRRASYGPSCCPFSLVWRPHSVRSSDGSDAPPPCANVCDCL